MMWSYFYFFLILYFLFVLMFILYLMPLSGSLTTNATLKSHSGFIFLNGLDLQWVLLTPLVLILLFFKIWTSPVILAWFGHILFTNYQFRLGIMIVVMFGFLLTIYSTVLYYSSQEIYDFIIVNINFFYWILLLFTANTFFTIVFLIEILSTLVVFLIITSSFSTSFMHNNTNMSHHLFFQQTTPYFYILSIVYFFWISLLASVVFYFFLLIFFINFLTFDWFLFEYLFSYLILISSTTDLLTFGLIWFGCLFSIFLKTGLVPFYLWKPVFFKGLSFHVLFFYITFYYFFILIFFVYLFLNYFVDLFFTYLVVNMFFLLLGFLILLIILCESYYLKSFLALSSILNTLFIFLILNATNVVDVICLL